MKNLRVCTLVLLFVMGGAFAVPDRLAERSDPCDEYPNCKNLCTVYEDGTVTNRHTVGGVTVERTHQVRILPSSNALRALADEIRTNTRAEFERTKNFLQIPDDGTIQYIGFRTADEPYLIDELTPKEEKTPRGRRPDIEKFVSIVLNACHP